MAVYKTTIRSTLSATEAFAYMADLRNLREWDPGTSEVERLQGDGGEGSVYAVKLDFGTRPTLRYQIRHYDAPGELRFVAKTPFLVSDDRIKVRACATGGSLVTYEAELRFRGPLKALDRGLRWPFRRLGDRAAAGLRRSIGGRD